MDRTIKIGYFVNIIFALLILVADVCFIAIDCSAYITKTIASALFVLCGVFNLVYVLSVLKEKRKIVFYCLMLSGLVFAMTGDILLIDNFVLGAIFFGVGHILFLLSFCFLSNLKLRDLLIGAVIFVGSFLLIEFYKGFDFGNMKVLVVVYALIISLMLGKALSNVFESNNKPQNIVIFVGALLFFVSDLMLVFYLFARRVMVFDILCLAAYYPAEFILAFSIFFVSIKEREKQADSLKIARSTKTRR